MLGNYSVGETFVAYPIDFPLFFYLRSNRAISLFNRSSDIPFFLRGEVGDSGSQGKEYIVKHKVAFVSPYTVYVFVYIFGFRGIRVSFHLCIDFLIDETSCKISFTISCSGSEVIRTGISTPVFDWV